jgi:hypothetical protein
MKDIKEGIKKAIDEFNEQDVAVQLTDKEKKLIEYGYVQCALQIGCDIVTKDESFLVGLQEIILEKDELIKQLEHATEQWNIWCKAYNEMSDKSNELPY